MTSDISKVCLSDWIRYFKTELTQSVPNRRVLRLLPGKSAITDVTNIIKRKHHSNTTSIFRGGLLILP